MRPHFALGVLGTLVLGVLIVVTLPAFALYVWYAYGFTQAAIFAVASAVARALLNFVSKGFIVGGMITRYEREVGMNVTREAQLPPHITMVNGWREAVVSVGVPVAAYLIMF